MTQIQLMTIWQSIVTFCTAAAWKIIVTLLILGIGFKLIRFFLKALRRGKGFSKLDAGVQTFLLSGMNIALKAVLIITAAAYIGSGCGLCGFGCRSCAAGKLNQRKRRCNSAYFQAV